MDTIRVSCMAALDASQMLEDTYGPEPARHVLVVHVPRNGPNAYDVADMIRRHLAQDLDQTRTADYSHPTGTQVPLS